MWAGKGEGGELWGSSAACPARWRIEYAAVCGNNAGTITLGVVDEGRRVEVQAASRGGRREGGVCVSGVWRGTGGGGGGSIGLDMDGIGVAVEVRHVCSGADCGTERAEQRAAARPGVSHVPTLGVLFAAAADAVCETVNTGTGTPDLLAQRQR